MNVRPLIALLLAMLSYIDSKAEVFELRQFIESKMAILENRQKQLDTRGIYVGDLCDFLDPISLLSHDSIDYDPHIQRLKYSKYSSLKRWMSESQEIVFSPLYLEAYYACYLHSGKCLVRSIPVNKYLEIIPVEILNEDLNRRVCSDNKNKAKKDSLNVLDFLLIDNDYAIDSLVANTVFLAITSDPVLLSNWVEDLSKFEEKNRITITRKMFVYYFYSFFKGFPLGNSDVSKEVENCWNIFVSSPMKKWLLNKDADYYLLDHSNRIMEPLNDFGHIDQ